ncbi:MAG TPA: hypothetical protein VGF21_14060, partial [Thermoleophilaceae bacterium]
MRYSRRRPLAVAAGLLLGLEAVLTAAGAEVPALTVAALFVVPGLALVAVLPAAARQSWSAALAAVPVLGFAATSVALISLASAGVSLAPLPVHLVLAALVAVGFALPPPALPDRPGRAEALAGLGLVGALALGIVLQQRVINGFPLPGNDWAKYVLYGDEIRAHGKLLIDNPFWMLGVPFRDDPGVPAVYGAYLRLADQPAPAVAHGIGLFASLQVLSVFALVRAFWGRLAAVIAAGLWAALPLNITLLGWHGLANAAALALMALLLLYATALVRNELDGSAAAGAGLTLVALAAVHRLSFVVALAALVLTLVTVLALRGDRAGLLRPAGIAVAFAIVISPGVAYELAKREQTFGGTLHYTAYLSSKLDLGLLMRDLTVPFVAVTAAAAVAALLRAHHERALIPLLGTLAAIGLLAYSWVVHLPLDYTRMAYYLPVALVPLAAVFLARAERWRGGAAVGAVLVVFLAGTAFAQGDNVKRFYAFANRGSLRGLDAVAASIEPREV